MGSDRDSDTTKDFQEEELAAFCLEHALLSAFRMDMDGRILYVNRKACDSLGYSKAELLQMSAYDINPILNPDLWPFIWGKLCEEGSLIFESQHRRKDGTVFPVEIAASLIEFKGQHYIMSLIKDITEYSQLYESAHISQLVFDKAQFGIFLVKEGGSIVKVNEYACQYLGYSAEELCRMRIIDIDRRYSQDEIEGLRLKEYNEGTVRFESVHRRKDGTDIPVEITGNLLEFNNEWYSVAFVRDIFEKKETKTVP